MGLFDVFRKKEAPPTFETHYSMTVFVSEKALKIAYSDAVRNLVGNLNLEYDGKTIALKQGNATVFVLSNKSKGYKELMPFLPYGVYSVTLSKSKGNYGFYYPAKFLFMLEREEGNRVAMDALLNNLK